MKNLLFFSVLIVAALGAGIWTKSLRPAASPVLKQENPTSVLHFDPQSLSFGEVWEEREYMHSVRVENRGPEKIQVEEVSCASCKGNALAIKPDRFELAPGSSQTIQVTLNLSLGGSRQSDAHLFAIPLRLIYSTAASSPGNTGHAFGEIKGTVKPFLATQQVWNLGTRLRASGPFECRYEVEALIPLGDLEVELLPPSELELSFSVNRRPDKPNSIHIIARSGSPAKSGLLRAEVVLRAKTVDGISLPPKRVPIEMDVTDRDIRVSPPELYFVGAKVGSTVESLVTVSSLSGREFSVQKAEPTGMGLEVSAGGNPKEFRVSQQVTRAGLISGVVSFTAQTVNGIEKIDVTVNTVGIKTGNN